MNKRIIPGLIGMILGGCSLAPTYQRPALPLPEHFKETGRWKKITKEPQLMTPDTWWLLCGHIFV